MEIKTVKYVISSPTVQLCPKTTMPEYAFIGRSNVGKSSLINMLTGHSKLAMVSGQPGKTQTINHFIVNDNWYLVDLPGYGYAKVAQQKREEWQKNIRQYLLLRENLYCVFVLVDIRLEPQTIDIEFINFLGENQVPIAIIFTKADKLGPDAGKRNAQKVLDKLSEEWEELPPHFISSAEKKTGRTEILHFIHQANKNTENSID